MKRYTFLFNILLLLLFINYFDIMTRTAVHYVEVKKENKQLKKLMIEVVEKICKIGGVKKNAGGITSNIRNAKYAKAIELVQTLPVTRREKTDAENLEAYGLVKYEWKYKEEFGYPVQNINKAYITNEYSDTHHAIDIATLDSSDIISVADGVIYQIGIDWRAGRFVIISHLTSDGAKWFSSYAHLNSVTLHKNDVVIRGQTIGEMGETGEWQTGRHLHFCLSKKIGKNFWTRNPMSNCVRETRIHTKSYIGVM